MFQSLDGIAGICFWVIVLAAAALIGSHHSWYDGITDKAAWWTEFCVAVGTIGLGAVTAWLAYRTSEMANDAKLARDDTARQLAQDDLHHRQQLTCIVGVDICELTERTYRTSPMGDYRTGMELTKKPRNLGSGPALSNNAVLLIPDNEEPNRRELVVIPNIAANSESSATASFFNQDGVVIHSGRWVWAGATLTFTSHTIFGDSVTMVYRFVGLVAYEEDYEGPDELQDGPTAIFIADPFDIGAFGQRVDN